MGEGQREYTLVETLMKEGLSLSLIETTTFRLLLVAMGQRDKQRECTYLFPTRAKAGEKGGSLFREMTKVEIFKPSPMLQPPSISQRSNM